MEPSITPSSKNDHYRWNFTVNLLDGASYWFGYSFISTSTIFPLFISKLTDSLWPIGLISLISSAGWFLPQLISARITEGYAKMKVIVVGWGLFLERLPVWLMVLSAFIANRSPQLALILFLLFFTWFSLGAGVVAPSWMALLAKIFSPEKRGSFALPNFFTMSRNEGGALSTSSYPCLTNSLRPISQLPWDVATA
ncbi:MAG: hypothetical protein ACK2TV_06770, partial [Anaerolineales bacterium]